jgi:hypothetical protein
LATEGEAADLRTLYVENGRVAAVFWERREKGIALFLAAVAGVAVGEAWLYWGHPGRLMAIPVGFAVVVAYLAAHLHERTRDVLRETYSVGAILERAILEREPSLSDERLGIFTRLHDATPSTLGPLLTWVYAGFGVLALALTAAALGRPPQPATVGPTSPLPAAADGPSATVSTAYVIRSATTVGP